MIDNMVSDPPLLQHYQVLMQRSKLNEAPLLSTNDGAGEVAEDARRQEWKLPIIDMGGLIRCCSDDNNDDGGERIACMEAIGRASSEWGFFQVVNHGIRSNLLDAMRKEEKKLFEAPFERKLVNRSYRWGNANATCPGQLSWSEAFHISLAEISQEISYESGEFSSLREVVFEFAKSMLKLAKLVVGVLAEWAGQQYGAVGEMCDESTCFLRLNRYPICPISDEVFGLAPHTDSDFLTILCQDHVNGLQLKKRRGSESEWVPIRPIQDALIVNIGDLLQAWSNDVYKSVEHKVVANNKMERYSIAYFLCPSYDALIETCSKPSIYKNFTFGEYKSQVQEDVQMTGNKVGLSRFRL